jgi:hypothetical protein
MSGDREARTKAMDAARWRAEQSTKDAKATLLHYFKLAIPNMSADMRGEIESAVDNMIDAAVRLAEAKQLEAELDAAIETSIEAEP